MKCPKDGKEKTDTDCLDCEDYSALFSICDYGNREDEHSPYCDCEECRAGHMGDTSQEDRARKGLGVTS